jgi:glyoxylase I family protein
MKFEHFATNVPDPRAQAAWLVEHLGMRILRAEAQPPYAHFLADSTGRPVLEIYANPQDPIPEHASVHHLRLHWAFVSADPLLDRGRLEGAGATFVEEARLPDGSHIITLRDPWGLPVQLCKRAVPLGKE